MEPINDPLTKHPLVIDLDAPVRGARRRRLRLLLPTAALVVAGGTTAGFVASATGAGATTTTSATSVASHRGGPGGLRLRPTADGTVQSVDTAGSSFVLKQEDGTLVTVDVGSSTTYVDPAVSSPGLANVTAKEHVAVVGTSASGTVTATKVLIGMPHGGPGGPGDWGAADGPGGVKPTADGTVQSVDTASNSFVLKEEDGTLVTVDVGSSTTYVDPAVSSPGLANVTAKEHVAVVGTSASGTVTATKVLIGMPHGGPGGPGGPGRPHGPGGPGDWGSPGGDAPASPGSSSSSGSGSSSSSGTSSTSAA